MHNWRAPCSEWFPNYIYVYNTLEVYFLSRAQIRDVTLTSGFPPFLATLPIDKKNLEAE